MPASKYGRTGAESRQKIANKIVKFVICFYFFGELSAQVPDNPAVFADYPAPDPKLIYGATLVPAELIFEFRLLFRVFEFRVPVPPVIPVPETPLICNLTHGRAHGKV